jgi:PAS domain S-box-containing protein
VEPRPAAPPGASDPLESKERLLFPASTLRLVAGMTIAVVGPVAAAWLAMHPLKHSPTLGYLAVIVAATLLGRLAPGLLAVLWCSALYSYYTIPPPNALEPGDIEGLLSLAMFTLVAVILAELLARRDAATDRAVAEKDRARRVAERSQLALRAGDLGTWAWNVGSGQVLWDEPMERIYGLPPGTFDGSYEAYKALLHPDDRDDVLRAVQEGMETGKGHHIEHQVVRPDGQHRWVEGWGEVVRDADGHVSGLIGIARDVSERRETEEELERLVAAERGAREDAERASARVTALRDLALALSKAASIDDIARTVSERWLGSLDAIGTVIVQREGDELETVGAGGLEADVLSGWTRFPLGADMPIAETVRIGEPIFLRSRREREERYPRMVSRGVATATANAWATLPLVTKGEVTGAMGVVFDRPSAFDDEDRALLSAVAEQCAQSIERVRAREGEAAEAEQVRRLQGVTAGLSRALTQEDVAAVFAREGVHATGATAGIVAVLGDDGNTLRTLATAGYDEPEERGREWSVTQDAPIATAVATSEPVWLERRDAVGGRHPRDGHGPTLPGFGAFAAIPLHAADRVIGVIGLSFEGERRFPEEERAHLVTMTGQVEVAMERARLFEEAAKAREDAREANQRLRFLSDATLLLSSSLDYDETVGKLAHLCVPTFADWASVDLLEPDGSVRQLVVAHEDPERVAYAKQLRERYPLDMGAPTGLANVIRTGRSEFLPEVPEKLIRISVTDEKQPEAALGLRLSSMITAPLSIRGNPIGALTLAYAESGRRYDEHDLRMAESLARRAAVAIDNARVYRDRDHMASTLQRSLLPPGLARIPGASLAARYEPFGDGHEAGGDFYDAFPVGENEWSLVVGDVCGKGAEAAAVMGAARFTLRALSMQAGPPSELLHRLNEALLRHDTSDRFCTVCYCRVVGLDEGFEVTVSLGGHPPPVVLRADGGTEAVGRPGSLLGIYETVELQDQTVRLSRGDAIVLYTDGVFGRSDLAEASDLLAKVPTGTDVTADDIAGALVAVSRDHVDEGLTDDVAVVVLKMAAR